MSPKKREYFNRQVDWVVERLPKKIRRMLDVVPLHVEDYPPRWLLRELGIRHPNDLLGCFSGVPKHRDTFIDHRLPNVIAIYRSGIFEQAIDEKGVLRRDLLREQIRVTILHELAHYVGYNEEGVSDLGYG